MRRWTKNATRLAMVTAGFVAFGGGVAHADTSGDHSLLSGNQVNPKVSADVKVCGNNIAAGLGGVSVGDCGKGSGGGGGSYGSSPQDSVKGAVKDVTGTADELQAKGTQQMMRLCGDAASFNLALCPVSGADASASSVKDAASSLPIGLPMALPQLPVPATVAINPDLPGAPDLPSASDLQGAASDPQGAASQLQGQLQGAASQLQGAASDPQGAASQLQGAASNLPGASNLPASPEQLLSQLPAQLPVPLPIQLPVALPIG